MKILMYGWEFPPEISGGLGMACYGIVNELAKKGLGVNLVLPKKTVNITQNSNVEIISCEQIQSNSTILELEKLGARIGITQIDTLLHPYITEALYDSALISLGEKITHRSLSQLLKVKLTGKYGPNLIAEVFRYAMLLSNVASEVPHDIIHAHDWLTGLAGIEAKKHSKKPFILQIHALEYDRCGENVNKSIYAIEKYTMEHADCIIAVSQYTKNVIINHYGINPNKIKVVHNGNYPAPRKTPKFKKLPNQKMVLFLGRITHQKGAYYFIDVANKILSQRSDVQFVIAGGGDTFKDMILKVANLQIGKNVHFTGFLTQDIVKELYPLADVYVMPSVSEPFGLTCLEALSHGIPVVISKQSGVSEVLNFALKADFWDIDEFAAKILALLDYEVLREEYLRQSKQDMQKLTWENTANNLINIYRELC